MTLEEYKAKIDRLFTLVPEALRGEAIQSAGNGLVRRMKDRIFNQGLDRDNKIIAEAYSRKPIYVVKEQFVKRGSFKARGKNSASSKFDNGNRRKSMYLPGGYEELKKIQNLGDNVNFFYRGDLKRAFVAQFQDGVLLIGFNSQKQADKRRYLEKKYNKVVFHYSVEEMLEYNAALIRQLQRVMRENFS